jgi:drug/metabolite transporter (DMT)-like permease
MSQSHSVAAIAMIVLASLLFSAMDASVKYLGAFLPLVLVLWTRYAVQAIAMAVWIWRTRGKSGFRATHPRFQLLRGALLLAVSALAFYSVQIMPLAEFTAIIMLWPVLATAAAGWFFHETVGRLRWALVWGGFIGTLIVIRPGSELFGWAVVVPLITAVAATAYNLMTRRLAVLDNPTTTQLYTGITGVLVLAPLLAPGAGAPIELLRAVPSLVLVLLVLIGALGTIGHLLLILAFGRAGAATLMPFTYTQIGFAAMIGWLTFKQTPDLWAWIGMVIIAICGAATAWINVHEAQRTGVPAAALEPAAD